MMKKKAIKIVILVLVLSFLLLPFPQMYKDGGTKTFTSLTYKIICWNELPAYDGRENKKGVEIYFFPNNFFRLSYYRSK